MIPDGPTVLAGVGTVTLIDGLTFAISDLIGDIADRPEGLISDDTRFLSRLALRVEGAPLRALGAGVLTASAARFRGFGVPGPGHLDAPLEVDRRRRVRGGGLEEEVMLRWWAEAPGEVAVEVEVDADFADIFTIRRAVTGAPAPAVVVRRTETADGVRLVDDDSGLATRVRFDPAPDSQEAGVARWRPRLRRGEPWRLHVAVEIGDGPGAEPRPPRAPASARPAVAVVSEPGHLALACRRAMADLDALSMPDAMDGGRRLVAAGIPWFVALFGRDSLIAGHQARAFLPEQLLDTLAALAARQGRVSDPGNEEEPGKILHEVRLTRRPWLGEGTSAGAAPYFGTMDATPLFLVLYGQALRWGASRPALEGLLPAARAALGWLRGPGDPDGDGFIEHRGGGARSLANQGWKDSANAVQHSDGALAEGPLAMVEVQGYAYRARRALADVLRHLGHQREAASLEDEAADLRGRIRAAFWHPGAGGRPGSFAMALDGRKRQVASVASNMGHLLWCGVPSPEEAAQVAEHLSAPEMSSGWGLRTLSRRMAGFNPISYHLGSVWPHDTAIACEGLRRYGLDVPALRLAGDLIDAMAAFDHRLPELFGGHDREPGDVPVPYPTACRPQAWAAGVPLQLTTMLIGLEPHVPRGRLALAPALPPGVDRLEVTGIPLPGGPLSVRVDRAGGTRILEAPPDLVIELRAPGRAAPAAP